MPRGRVAGVGNTNGNKAGEARARCRNCRARKYVSNMIVSGRHVGKRSLFSGRLDAYVDSYWCNEKCLSSGKSKGIWFP